MKTIEFNHYRPRRDQVYATNWCGETCTKKIPRKPKSSRTAELHQQEIYCPCLCGNCQSWRTERIGKQIEDSLAFIAFRLYN